MEVFHVCIGWGKICQSQLIFLVTSQFVPYLLLPLQSAMFSGPSEMAEFILDSFTHPLVIPIAQAMGQEAIWHCAELVEQ